MYEKRPNPMVEKRTGRKYMYASFFQRYATILHVLFGNLLFSLNISFLFFHRSIVYLILWLWSVPLCVWNKQITLSSNNRLFFSKNVQFQTYIFVDSLQYFCGVDSQKCDFESKNMWDLPNCSQVCANVHSYQEYISVLCHPLPKLNLTF